VYLNLILDIIQAELAETLQRSVYKLMAVVEVVIEPLLAQILLDLLEDLEVVVDITDQQNQAELAELMVIMVLLVINLMSMVVVAVVLVRLEALMLKVLVVMDHLMSMRLDLETPKYMLAVVEEDCFPPLHMGL